MKLIKNSLILILLLCSVSCTKPEFFSTGEWKLDKYYYNHADSTAGYSGIHENYRLDLGISHGFSESEILNEAPYIVGGSWDISTDIKTLRLNDTLNGVRQFEVKEASTTSLKIKKDVEEWWLTRP